MLIPGHRGDQLPAINVSLVPVNIPIEEMAVFERKKILKAVTRKKRSSNGLMMELGGEKCIRDNSNGESSPGVSLRIPLFGYRLNQAAPVLLGDHDP